MKFLKFKCNRCEHEWMPRKEECPRWCPECHSPYWNKERRIPKTMVSLLKSNEQNQ